MEPLNSNSSKKLVVIGLDGGSFDVIDPLIEEGKLPNIERLIREGVRGKLQSTMPPVTAPAWASFMTGKSPALHGIFDFVKRLPNDFRRQIVNFKHIDSKTLWAILNENGKKIGVINVPLTYPPPKVNGFLISGMMTPSIQSQYTFPASLARDLKKKFGKYILDIQWQTYGPTQARRFIQDLMTCTDLRGKIVLHLMDKQEWDFFMPVFVGTDRIQHALWNILFPANFDNLSKSEREIRKLIIKYYQKIDNVIGRIVKTIDGKANLVILSDHGFGPLKKKVYINKWLEDLGFLSLNCKKFNKFIKKKQIVPVFKNILKGLDFLNLRERLLLNIRKNPVKGAAYGFDCIDWSKTVAYAASNTQPGIYINLAGREPYGIVQPGKEWENMRELIMKKLRDFEDPLTKEKLVSRIYKREEIYSGPHMDNAPDIIFYLKEGEYLAAVQPMDYLFEESSWKTGAGTHRLEGIFIGYGKDIKSGVQIKGAEIIDLAPTILNLMNVPISDDMDGKLLKGIFTDNFLKTNPPQYIHLGKEGYSDTSGDRHYSEKEEAQVKNRLKGLGYLD